MNETSGNGVEIPTPFGVLKAKGAMAIAIIVALTVAGLLFGSLWLVSESLNNQLTLQANQATLMRAISDVQSEQVTGRAGALHQVTSEMQTHAVVAAKEHQQIEALLREVLSSNVRLLQSQQQLNDSLIKFLERVEPRKKTAESG